jgi:hypothetical protein
MVIFQSASKIVFLLITVTACVGFLTKILPVEDFKDLAMMAFSFYFSITQAVSKIAGKEDKT